MSHPVLFLINWRILPDKKNIESFLTKWKTVLKVRNKDGLVGEFLSEVKDPDFFQYVTWELKEHAEGEYRKYIRSEKFVSYVNVGIWRSKEDFLKNIGGNLPKDPWSMEDFEAAPRRRGVVDPVAWRIGSYPLPTETSPGVDF